MSFGFNERSQYSLMSFKYRPPWFFPCLSTYSYKSERNSFYKSDIYFFNIIPDQYYFPTFNNLSSSSSNCWTYMHSNIFYFQEMLIISRRRKFIKCFIFPTAFIIQIHRAFLKATVSPKTEAPCLSFVACQKYLRISMHVDGKRMT